MNMKLALKIINILSFLAFCDFTVKMQIVNQIGASIELTQFEDSEVTVDGYLDESVWQSAAKMNNFNNFLPVDGSLADDDADILIWYSKEAIYFGIRANANPEEVRSTLADRDKLESDDYLMIILDTYNDQRTAYAFGVNPLGQQADGTITDNVPDRKAAMPFTIDKNPDYVFESKGRIVETGFVIEVKIPFKSLRYNNSEVQNWGFNVLRSVQHSRYLLSLTQAKLGEASFLAQNSQLTNIKNIKTKRLFDINPELRNALNRAVDSKDFTSQTNDPLGVNIRYGLSSNTVLNATLNPDFSQIEADVAQISYEPRLITYLSNVSLNLRKIRV